MSAAIEYITTWPSLFLSNYPNITHWTVKLAIKQNNALLITHRRYSLYSSAGVNVGISGQPGGVFRSTGVWGRTQLRWGWDAMGRLVVPPQVQQLEAPCWVLPEETRSGSLETVEKEVDCLKKQNRKYHHKSCGGESSVEPWCCQRLGKTAGIAGNTGFPTPRLRTGFHWTSLREEQSDEKYHIHVRNSLFLSAINQSRSVLLPVWPDNEGDSPRMSS